MERKKAARSQRGKRKPHSTTRVARNPGIGLLGPDKLRQLYTAMLHCRLIEEEVSRLSKDGRIAGNHSPSRQEATEVGAIIGLRPHDCCAPRRRDVVAGYILGRPLKAVFTQLLTHSGQASPADLERAPGTSSALILSGAAAMAARINISTGVALAYKTQKKPGVVVAFSGGDSTALASWREAVDFAIQQRLPIVHVVQDDLSSESAHSGRQSTADKSSIPRLVVDGNDVVAVYRVAQEAIRRAREGHGPTLIECKTPRWPGYSGIAPAQNQSSAKRRPDGAAHDAIAVMEAYLAQKGLWSHAWKQKLVQTFRKQLDAAIQGSR